MKKITLLTFCAFFAAASWQAGAQVVVSETMDADPAGFTDSYAVSASQACEGSSLRDNLYSGSAAGDLTSPNYTGASNGTDLAISFDYKVVDWSAATVATAAGWGTAQVQYSSDDGTTWTTAPMGTIDDTNHVVSNECANFSTVVPGASLPDGGDVRFRILNTWTSGDYYFYIDNLVAAQTLTCDFVTDVVADPVTSNEATVNWNASVSGETAWEYAVVLSGSEIPASGTSTDTTSFTDSTLMSGFGYDVYVRADCGADDGTGPWVITSFTTPCLDLYTGDYTANMAVNAPTCWEEADNGLVAEGPMDFGASSWNSATFGNDNYYFDADGVQKFSNRVNLFANFFGGEWLVSPEFDLSGLAEASLIVEAAITDYNNGDAADPDGMTGTDDEVQVLVSNDDGVTWVNLYTWSDAAGQIPEFTGSEIAVDLVGYLGSTVRFAIFADDGEINDLPDYDFHVGKFEINTVTECVAPTNITLANETGTTADISWDEAPSAVDGYGVAVLLQGDDPDVDPFVYTSAIVPQGTFTDTATGLSEGVAYDAYVVSLCDLAANELTFSAPVPFNTTLGLADSAIVDYTIFPNPATNSINLSAAYSIENIVISNVLGQQVMANKGGSNELTLDIANLQVGTYFMRATVNGIDVVERFIKK